MTRILQAVALLGLDRLRVLATTAALRMRVNVAVASPALSQCWRHSVATALVAQDLAAGTFVDTETAYTAGLLHDIGRFAMLSCWPSKYGQLLATCRPSEELEQEFEVLGSPAYRRRRIPLTELGLPLALAEVAGEHHHCRKCQRELVGLISRACAIADFFGFSATAMASSENVPQEELDGRTSDYNALCMLVADGINQIECL